MKTTNICIMTTIIVVIMITATAMTIDSTFSDDQQNNDESNNTESILKKLLTNLSTLNNRLIRIEKIVNDLQQCHRNDQQHHQGISFDY